MTSTQSGQLPIYIVKWKLRGNERGRKHMAAFIPNSQHIDIDPSNTSTQCLGTLLQVQGSPMMGFEHNIKRNWHRERSPIVESFHFLASVDASYSVESRTSEFVDDDEKPNGVLDQLALTVRPPRVSQPLWDAEAIFDCQDWVVDYVARLIQKKIVDATVLDRLTTLLDPKVALIPQPGSTLTSAPPITASVVRLIEPDTAESSVAAKGNRVRYTNSEWDGERKAFKRYDQTAQQWECRDKEGVWKTIE